VAETVKPRMAHADIPATTARACRATETRQPVPWRKGVKDVLIAESVRAECLGVDALESGTIVG
jgi:hypothetical protein